MSALPQRLITGEVDGAQAPSQPSVRLRLEIQGAVQGVGFRPFVYRVAGQEKLAGWVLNDARGVICEVEGPPENVEHFRHRMAAECPPAAVVHDVVARWRPLLGESGFRIVASDGAAIKSVVILPDLATCKDCRDELFDPSDRRYRYPFINCTNCGPRFTIVEDLPYDRAHTTMRHFEMCPDCRNEYEDPLDRRFHAQPDACPKCGPRLQLTDSTGSTLARHDEALRSAAAAIRAGRILALKGIGGYQLIADARSEEAVARLRERKLRPVKPLAVMVGDLATARRLAEISSAEAALLRGREAPIVLLARRPAAGLAPSVAPASPNLGVMLPTTPLHHLLLAELRFPVVATSGNLTDEPIVIEDDEALRRLGGIADLFLSHDRPIARHVDDSVAWIVDERPQLLRRARGYAPLPVLLSEPGPTLVAVGAHQKDVAALAIERQVFLSQHIGDMETPEAHAAFARVLLDFIRVYDANPEAIAFDLHPDYATTAWARDAVRSAGGLLARCGRAPVPLTAVPVQHHHAHLAALVAEQPEPREIFALTWDGTGYGPDGTIWGGELLRGDAAGFERMARLRPFRLLGGEAAVQAPWRVALALLWEIEGENALESSDLHALRDLSAADRGVLRHMLGEGLRSPLTSSVGRLFDGVAALAGISERVSFEGEAAIRLESMAEEGYSGAYPLDLAAVPAPPELAPAQRARPELLEIDWRPLVVALLADRARGVPAATLAARFHASLTECALMLARRFDAPEVGLTGGCFQNRRLTQTLVRRLRAERRQALVHRIVPTNDGGIALGQVAVARARLLAEREPSIA